ncbi:MAG: hypothetical protein DSY60_01600 [Persephonella sp.]|nr:MAG: hypothetical protein DSY60_01600 [Persephonella sp.]
MTKVIIKPDNKEEIVISTHLSPEEIEKIIREFEEERLYQKALKELFGILKTDKSIDEIREEVYGEIYNR